MTAPPRGRGFSPATRRKINNIFFHVRFYLIFRLCLCCSHRRCFCLFYLFCKPRLNRYNSFPVCFGFIKCVYRLYKRLYFTSRFWKPRVFSSVHTFARFYFGIYRLFRFLFDSEIAANFHFFSFSFADCPHLFLCLYYNIYIYICQAFFGIFQKKN